MTDWININKQKPKEGQCCLVYCPEETTIKYGTAIYSSTWTSEFTHWMPLPEPPRKVRWLPQKGEEYFLINGEGSIRKEDWGRTQNYGFFFGGIGGTYREFLGVYRTEKEAKVMRKKIKNFVTQEIGECE